MKLSNEKILSSINTLANLSNVQLPVRLAYGVSKNINNIEIELKIYNAEKDKLINKYAVKDATEKIITDKNGNIEIKEENIEAWNRDIIELLSIESEINIHAIKLEDLLKVDYNISPAELNSISFMIEE